MSEHKKITMGMVGGGPGSFIGPVHRMAAELDGGIELICGAFSRDAAKSRSAGDMWGLPHDRVYAGYHEMLACERNRTDRPDFISIVTPNHFHFPIAREALEARFHVLSDKPATATHSEAQALERIVRESGRLYGLTYTYTGYPLVREARDLCRRGELGAIRKVVAEYSQGWLSTALEQAGHKQALWRTNPAQAGAGGCSGDIGVHAFNMVEFVTGLRISRICADLSIVVAGRALDDDCNVLLRLDNGAPGLLFASQIAAGERNGLRLRVYGDRGGMDWSQEAPNTLLLNWLDRPSQILHGGAGAAYLADRNRREFRLPLGHPEGYIEAFANIYRDFAAAIRSHAVGPIDSSCDIGVVTIAQGVRDMLFVEAALKSSAAGSQWVTL
jgi:predicted dehydrogenase